MATESYSAEARKAIGDRILQEALSSFQQRLGKVASEAINELPQVQRLRLEAHRIRMQDLNNLDVILEVLAENVRRNGGNVFFAKDGNEAVDYCLWVAHKNGVKRVVKGKSMVTEEIGLNQFLIQAGLEVSETDLGEYIIQLAGETPSHFTAPAIHKTKEQIGALFARELGIPYTSDPVRLTKAARKVLRQSFLTADMGISGCNLACAETGHITTVSNEGNIRMVTTLPKVHVAFMGMERVTSRLAHHGMFFKLLSRAAIGQSIAGYVTYMGGPRVFDHADGPKEFHLVIVDNGRSRILADKEFREILCCIRCAACVNVCPVYGKIGGHAYGHLYSGPLGAVLTPLLYGIVRRRDLCLGETLCGACRDACPLNIDIPRMILSLRAKLAEGDPVWQVRRYSRSERVAYRVWSLLMGNRKRYDLFHWLTSRMQTVLPRSNGMIRLLPYPLNGWTRERNMAPLAAKSFHRRWSLMNGERPNGRQIV